MLSSCPIRLKEHMYVVREVMQDERAQAIMTGYHDLVESGRREIYTVEA